MGSRLVVIVGAGNAALCAGIAALDAGAEALMLEKAPEPEAGGNSRYTAGAMRFVYHSAADLLPLLSNPSDARLAVTDFGSYPAEKFRSDMEQFQAGKPLNPHQAQLIGSSYDTMRWLHWHKVRFEPIYERQSFVRNGRNIFWGGLTLAAHGEGAGLVDAQLREFLRLGGEIRYGFEMTALLLDGEKVTGVRGAAGDGKPVEVAADAVVLACGGFEASRQMRRELMGWRWEHAKVRGSPHNTGNGLKAALAAGAGHAGMLAGCHAVPMDMHTPDYGNLQLDVKERKQYRKICYFLGIMLNSAGRRFVDEGQNFRNYTYAQFGRRILAQPEYQAWQIFDSKVSHLLYSEYRTAEAHFVEADSLDALADQMTGIDRRQALSTIREFNLAVDAAVEFDPSRLDGRGTRGLKLPKTNWANALDTPPYRAYPVTCGITFTYGGIKIGLQSEVLTRSNKAIPGLYACGEIIGGIFFDGYPGGSGLTSGAVYGKIAGTAAATSAN